MLSTLKKVAIALAAATSLGGCVSTVSDPSPITAPSNEGSVIVGYIAAKGGQLDVEVIQRFPSSKQIMWLDENYATLQKNDQLVTGMKVHLVAYAGTDGGTPIWENISISTGSHRVGMPKSVVRNTGSFCLRVYGYRITNVENVQIRPDGSTSWCEDDLKDYVDADWMQGPDGGYGFPLILDRL